MKTLDTTISTIRRLIFQVNSSSNYKIYYFIIMNKITTSISLCRISRDVYKPRMKMRDRFTYEFATRRAWGLLKDQCSCMFSVISCARNVRPRCCSLVGQQQVPWCIVSSKMVGPRPTCAAANEWCHFYVSDMPPGRIEASKRGLREPQKQSVQGAAADWKRRFTTSSRLINSDGSLGFRLGFCLE
jgi:hypothetical protein